MRPKLKRLHTAARVLESLVSGENYNPEGRKALDTLMAALDAVQAQPVAYMYDQAQWNEGDLRGRGWYPKITRHLEGTENMRRNVVPLYTTPQAPQPSARPTSGGATKTPGALR